MPSPLISHRCLLSPLHLSSLVSLHLSSPDLFHASPPPSPLSRPRAAVLPPLPNASSSPLQQNPTFEPDLVGKSKTSERERDKAFHLLISAHGINGDCSSLCIERNDDRNLQRKPKISSASVGFHFVGGIQMFLNYKGANTSVSYNIPSLEISN
eukprot:TRINITY_DN11894_c1_g1_i1.p1 TRINITY_DN11894_c1_g1~~TRINITY_DN11894_c1_g1_i1.p1  ORF type:complete len:161 (-),score=25.22 TRINITY_DN11894_c1_g1_i1:645-1106(-)